MNSITRVAAAVVDTAEREYDATRQSVFNLSLATLIIGCLQLFCFWASYGWTLVPTIVAIIIGTVGRFHFPTLDTMRINTCCCNPLSAISNLKWMHVCNAVMSVLGVVSSIAAAVMISEVYTRIFASFSAVFMALLSVLGFRAWQDLSKLLPMAAVDPAFAVVVYPNASSVTVVQAQPYPTPPAQAGYPVQAGYPAAQGQPPPQQWGAQPQQQQWGAQPQQQQWGAQPQQQQAQPYPSAYPPMSQQQQQAGSAPACGGVYGYPPSQQQHQPGYPSQQLGYGAPPPPPQPHRHHAA